MGHTQAQGMADSGLPLRAQLDWHLTSNHYPPLPASMVDVAVQAIEEARSTGSDEWEVVLLDLPGGITFRGCSTITVAEAIESMHLEDFLNEPDEAEEEDAEEEPEPDLGGNWARDLLDGESADDLEVDD